MTAPLAHRKAYHLPRGYDVEFSFDGFRLDCQWSPAMPTGKLGRKLLPHYQAARNAFLAGLGIGVVVIDV